MLFSDAESEVCSLEQKVENSNAHYGREDS